MRPIFGATCEICGEALHATQGLTAPSLCGACQETRPFFARAVAYGSYDHELRELIHLLKYEQVLPASGFLGGMLAGAISKLPREDSPLLVVPVPLYKSKRRQRGFNQAELIARAALKCYARARRDSRGAGAFHSTLQLEPEVLVRMRPTVSQIGLTRPQRVENMRGAFQVAQPERIKRRSILLIDDVLTTGTTASECARVLRKAGAEKVLVATVARTMKHAAVSFEFEPDLEIAAG